MIRLTASINLERFCASIKRGGWEALLAPAFNNALKTVITVLKSLGFDTLSLIVTLLTIWSLEGGLLASAGHLCVLMELGVEIGHLVGLISHKVTHHLVIVVVKHLLCMANIALLLCGGR
jgi:hypothetical protein